MLLPPFPPAALRGGAKRRSFPHSAPCFPAAALPTATSRAAARAICSAFAEKKTYRPPRPCCLRLPRCVKRSRRPFPSRYALRHVPAGPRRSRSRTASTRPCFPAPRPNPQRRSHSRGRPLKKISCRPAVRPIASRNAASRSTMGFPFPFPCKRNAQGCAFTARRAAPQACSL